MQFGYVLLGIIIGLLAGSASDHMAIGVIGGGAIGLLLARLARLERRVRELESSPPPFNSTTERRSTDMTGPRQQPGEDSSQQPAVREPHWSEWDAEEAADADIPSVPPPALEPSLLQTGIGRFRRWLTRGNVPVKVGVIVSFIGFSFLLKYAVDRELIFLPLELRLAGVGLFGFAMSLLGWRLRTRARTYAISLQGGGLGIMFLTVFAGFRIWALLAPGWAFLLLVLLAFATGALALIQNARSLAILGTVGGFLAPLLASTGQGSHVALFSYYLVINGAVLGLAWFRAWRGLNLIGWVFTFVIGCYWGYQYYRPVLFSSTEPFLVVYFLTYNAIAILFSLRKNEGRSGMVDGALVFGTPVVLFAVQAALLRDSEYGLAWSALVLAVYYTLAALALSRRKGPKLRLLIESYMALAVAFVTLAVPLALDARWTSAAWALEGAALVWIGMRQSRPLARLAGAALIFAAGLAFMDDGWQSGRGLAVLNGNVLGGLLISLSALFSAWQFHRHEPGRAAGDYRNAYRLGTLGLFLWGLAWWTGTGLLESLDRVSGDGKLHVFLLFISGSTLLALQLDRRLLWTHLRRSGLLLGVFMALVAVWDFIEKQHFSFALGWLIWPAALAVQGRLLWVLDRADDRDWGAWHLASAAFMTTWVAAETYWQVDQHLSDSWSSAAAVSIAGVTPWLIRMLMRRSAWPVTDQRHIYLYAGALTVTLQVAYLTPLNLLKQGAADPLFYLPVVNPFDLAMLAVGGSAIVSLRMLREYSAAHVLLSAYRVLLGLAFFVLTTMALVRGVYHLHGGSWRWESLFESVVIQTSLSIYWGILGFGGMIWGARSNRRPIWMAGAGFMLLVVLKLFAVDLTQTGTIERIISFIGVGLLLLIVGYFAPAPPRDKPAETDPIGQ